MPHAPVCHVAIPLKICPGCDTLYDARGPRPCKAWWFCDNMADFREAFRKGGAVIEVDAQDGPYTYPEQYIDTARVHPDLLDAYRGLLQYGYANGLL